MDRLASQIKFPVDYIVAISRGGLVPAVCLARLLRVSSIDTIFLRSYTEDRKKGEVLFSPKSFHHLAGTNVLLVDDLVDTGETMAKAVKILSNFRLKTLKTAVVFYKVCSTFVPDYYIHKVDSDIWITFPWEDSPEKFFDADACLRYSGNKQVLNV